MSTNSLFYYKSWFWTYFRKISNILFSFVLAQCAIACCTCTLRGIAILNRFPLRKYCWEEEFPLSATSLQSRLPLWKIAEKGNTLCLCLRLSFSKNTKLRTSKVVAGYRPMKLDRQLTLFGLITRVYIFKAYLIWYQTLLLNK